MRLYPQEHPVGLVKGSILVLAFFQQKDSASFLFDLWNCFPRPQERNMEEVSWLPLVEPPLHCFCLELMGHKGWCVPGWGQSSYPHCLWGPKYPLPELNTIILFGAWDVASWARSGQAQESIPSPPLSLSGLHFGSRTSLGRARPQLHCLEGYRVGGCCSREMSAVCPSLPFPPISLLLPEAYGFACFPSSIAFSFCLFLYLSYPHPDYRPWWP